MKLMFVVPFLGANIGSKSSHGNPIFIFKFIFILFSCFSQFCHNLHLFLLLFLYSLSLLFLYFLSLGLLLLEFIQIKIVDDMERRYSIFFILWRIVVVLTIFILLGRKMSWFVFDNWWKCSWCLTESSDLSQKSITFWWLLVFPIWFFVYSLLME